MKKLNLLFAIMIMAAVAVGQSVGINDDNSTPDPSAMLDVRSTSKGFLAPRMASLPDPSSLPDGLIIYKNDGLDAEIGYYYTKNHAWIKFGSSSDATQWTTTGSDIYYNSGNVGIGTTGPYGKLDVRGGLITQTTTDFTLTSAGTAIGFSLGAQTGNTYGKITVGTDGDNAYGNLALLPGGGNVGIGTTIPSQKLDVNGIIQSKDGSGDGNLFLGGPNVSLRSSYTNDALGIYTANTERIRINSLGYVGIGTTSPAAPLHVGTSVNNFTAHGSSGVRYFNYETALTTATLTSLNDVAIFAEGDVVSDNSFVASSDKRIKTDIKELENSLDAIKKLNPVQYTKLDKIQYGNKLHYGFIAQEVEEVIPNAVNTSIGEVPVLKPFEKVSFEDGVEYTILVKNGDDINEQKYNTGDVRPIGDIIVKSKTVNDFKSITYDMIFTVAVDAIQEQQQLIEDQQKQIDELKAQNSELTQKANAIDELKAEVEKIKKAMGVQGYVAVNEE